MKDMSFRPGQLVECIDDALPAHLDTETTLPELDGLTRGRIYTVSCAGRFTRNTGDTFYCGRLAEITRLQDVPYFADRFVPVDDGRLDVFRKAVARKRELV